MDVSIEVLRERSFRVQVGDHWAILCRRIIVKSVQRKSFLSIEALAPEEQNVYSGAASNFPAPSGAKCNSYLLGFAYFVS